MSASAIVLLILCVQNASTQLKLSTNDLKLKLDNTENVTLTVRGVNSSAELHFIPQYRDITQIEPEVIKVSNENFSFVVKALGAGHSEISSNISDTSINIEDVYLRVTVYKNYGLDVFSIVIGWIYFAAWSVSFYPQIYTNFKRKSVAGLNFDFTWLNLVGNTLYGAFNLGLYFIPEIRDEHSARRERGLNPVQVNDIVFAVHAALASAITLFQCYFYERGGQKVSLVVKLILGIYTVFLTSSFFLVGFDVIHWLDFLNYCSYVKLSTTLIKYVPQAYMNYRRKSTVGWSIGNIFLDFIGGLLSMLQMLVNSWNYDDWSSILGDPTKFGLGLFSVLFDIFFIVQHYILYKHKNSEVNERDTKVGLLELGHGVACKG